MKIETTKTNSFRFTEGEVIDEYRVTTEGTIIGTLQVRSTEDKVDYRPSGTLIFGRANAWTTSRDEAIARIVRSVSKVAA